MRLIEAEMRAEPDDLDPIGPEVETEAQAKAAMVASPAWLTRPGCRPAYCDRIG